MKKIVAIAFAIFFSGSANANSIDSPSDREINFKHITNFTLENAILPGHKLFAENSTALHRNIKAVCNGGGLMSNAKQSYLETVLTWSGLEWITFGPIASNDRKMRLSFFPDKHKVGERQLRKAINSQDEAHVRDIAKGNASFALQGLQALDRILFKKDISKDAYSCRLATAISQNINTIAIELNRAWSEEYFELYSMNIDSENAMENAKEILESTRLFLQIMRDQKLGRALNIGKKVKPANVEYASSGYSLIALKINTLVIYKGINGSLNEVLSLEERKRFYDVAQSIVKRIDTAKYPLKVALKKDKEFVVSLYNDVNVFLILYNKMINKKFGFRQAFNALDGD